MEGTFQEKKTWPNFSKILHNWRAVPLVTQKKPTTVGICLSWACRNSPARESCAWAWARSVEPDLKTKTLFFFSATKTLLMARGLVAAHLVALHRSPASYYWWLVVSWQPISSLCTDRRYLGIARPRLCCARKARSSPCPRTRGDRMPTGTAERRPPRRIMSSQTPHLARRRHRSLSGNSATRPVGHERQPAAAFIIITTPWTRHGLIWLGSKKNFMKFFCLFDH